MLGANGKPIMRLPAGRSGHTVTLVQQEKKVLVFGGEKARAEECLSSKGEELLQLDLETMEWSAPTTTGSQPDLSFHTTTMVMLPALASQWSNLTAPPTSPHLFVLGGKTYDCVSGTPSKYIRRIHYYKMCTAIITIIITIIIIIIINGIWKIGSLKQPAY
jgi:hypothetical protein